MLSNEPHLQHQVSSSIINGLKYTVLEFSTVFCQCGNLNLHIHTQHWHYCTCICNFVPFWAQQFQIFQWGVIKKSFSEAVTGQFCVVQCWMICLGIWRQHHCTRDALIRISCMSTCASPLNCTVPPRAPLSHHGTERRGAWRFFYLNGRVFGFF